MAETAWPATRSSLMDGIRNWDDDAWREYVSVYGPILGRFCLRLGLQPADADDVVGAVLVRARTFTFDPAKGRFRDWLTRVMLREIDAKRRELARPGRHGAVGWDDASDRTAGDAGSEWEDLFHQGVLEAALRRVRSEFNAVDWSAFESTWLLVPNRPIEEVAQELGVSRGVIYKARSAILHRLEREVRRLAEDLPVQAGTVG